MVRTLTINAPEVVYEKGELGQEIANALKAKLSVSANFDRLKYSACQAHSDPAAALKGAVH